MRLIDADALMDAFRRYMVEQYDREKCVSEESCKTCERGCLWRKIVNNTPTIEAEPVFLTGLTTVTDTPPVEYAPVKHGRWKFKWDAEKDPKRLFVRIVCSECNLHTGQKSNYCPNCGAKMD